MNDRYCPTCWSKVEAYLGQDNVENRIYVCHVCDRSYEEEALLTRKPRDPNEQQLLGFNDNERNNR